MWELNVLDYFLRHKAGLAQEVSLFWILVLMLSNRCTYRVYINPSDPLKFFFFFLINLCKRLQRFDRTRAYRQDANQNNKKTWGKPN